MEHAGIRTYGSKSAWFLIDGVLVRPNVTVKVNITRSRCTHTLVPTSLPLAVPLIFARFFLISCNHALFSSSEIIEINQTTSSFNVVPRLQQIYEKFFVSLFTTFRWNKDRKYHLFVPHAREISLDWKFSSKESWEESFLYLFVIIDQSHHVLPRLFEKILLHTLPYVMMKESSFLVHQVVLPGEHRPSVSHSCVVADHHHCPVRFCQITARDGRGGLIINTYLRMHLFLFFLFSNKLLKLFRIKFCLHGESFIFIT